MTLVINTNVASLNAQRSLLRSQRDLSTSFQRLSTGLRINSAKDDAAGLAIASRFTAQVRGLNQAVRNANDGISLAQTTEAALNEVGGSLQRLRELAVQSANDTNSTSDRLALQAEADQLVSEIDRIATQTQFNGKAVLDGTFINQTFQIGANQGDTLSFSIDGARASALGATAQSTATVGAAAIGASEVTINSVEIRATAAADDALSFAGNDASAIAKAAAINASAAETNVEAIVGDTTIAGTAAVGAQSVAAADLLINGVDIGPVAVLANDSDSALRNAINAVTGQTGVVASLDGSNQLVLTAGDGRNITVTATADGETGSGFDEATQTFNGQITLKSDNDFTVVDGSSRIGASSAVVNVATNLNTLSLTSRTDAVDAIATLDDALRQVNGQQANLGAQLSRFESVVGSLTAVSENLSAARSRIQDADFAAETAQFSRNQILQQASVSILAQANVSTQVALSLLG
ncbi:MAG: flagellin [Myxococcota bacterium]